MIAVVVDRVFRWVDRGLVQLLAVTLAGSLASIGCGRQRDEDQPTSAAASVLLAAELQPPEPHGTGPDVVASPQPSDSIPQAPPSCPSWAKLDITTLPILPRTPYTDTFEQVWNTVLQKHYDPTIACKNWPELRMSYGNRLLQAKSHDEALGIINSMLGELGQSHFRVFGGELEAVDEARGAAHTPIRVRLVDDLMVVVEGIAQSKPPGGVPAGAVLLGIDGATVASMVEQAKVRATRPSEQAFWAARIVDARLHCPERYARTLRFRDPIRQDRESVRRVACELPEGDLVTLGNLHDVPTRVTWSMLKDTDIGHLAFNVWMLPMVQQVQRALARLRAEGMKRLVLDLRGNPGGVGAMSVPIARLLMDHSASLGTLQFRDFTQEFNVTPDDNPFTGPVVVLVDESTASTSEIFVAGLRDLGRVRVVGSRASVGAALPSIIEELEGGAILQYVVGDYHSPKGTAVEGIGIVPDILVPESRADFLAGRDRVLDRAVQAIAKE